MIRVFDFIASLIGLAVLSPVFLAVGAIIKLGDGGPVFYRQERVGRGGTPFRILKFRTMSLDADRSGALLTVGRDPRITRVGAFLRKWKLDEFPQLINVLRGEMGLVGPRPEVPRFVALYTGEQARVLALRPGITDAASITYRCENDVLTRCEDPEAFYIQHIMPNKIRINLDYAAKASLWGNLKVILATLGLAPPPVKVRQAGDLRAFDRLEMDHTARLVTAGSAPVEVRLVNLSLGGVLLGPGSPIPAGSTCSVALPTGRDLQGTVLRNDAKGMVVRFGEPLSQADLDTLGGGAP